MTDERTPYERGMDKAEYHMRHLVEEANAERDVALAEKAKVETDLLNVAIAREEITGDRRYLRNVIGRMEIFIRNIAENYDCDEDGHKHNTGCRVCEARALLDEKEGE